MRLFLGLPLATNVTDQLTRLSLRLRAKDDGLRWSVPGSWHITLQFLGNTQPVQYECLTTQLSRLRTHSLTVHLDGVGFFDRAGIFYAGIQLTPALLALQQKIVAVTAQCGFKPEARPYRPHITLARSKGKAGARGLRHLQNTLHAQPVFPSFFATEFLLYESTLTPSGSIYTVRQRFPLES